MSYKPPMSPMSHGHNPKSPARTRMSRESSALLRFDMRLPARVKAELSAGKQGKAVREYIDKANIRPVLVKCGRHETLRQYFEAMDKDNSGTLEFREVRRWLPKIGMGDNQEFRDAVDNHFRFMDKDGSEEIDFKEFSESTIDAADQKLSCYADEQYAKKFGMEIYMFLALCGRNKALKQFEKDEAKAYDPGNELLPFFQFERLMRSSQAVFMPFELYAPEDDSLTGQRRAARRPSSASRRKEAENTASVISSAAKSVFNDYSTSNDDGGDAMNGSNPLNGSDDKGEHGSHPHKNEINKEGGGDRKSPSLVIEPRSFDVDVEDEGNLNVDINDNNDGLGELISATASSSSNKHYGQYNEEDESSELMSGLSSNKQSHQASNKEGYEQFWGLGSGGDKQTKEIVKEIEQGLIENRRQWATRRRAEILSKQQKALRQPYEDSVWRS